MASEDDAVGEFGGDIFAASPVKNKSTGRDASAEEVADGDDEPPQEDDDLYGGLDEGAADGQGAATLRAAVRELQASDKQLRARVAELEKENTSLREENERLSSERATLVTNISTLFNTAREEIRRKDTAIADLRRQQEDARGRGGGRQGGGRGGRGQGPPRQPW
ncbi:unnamed protein product [Pedinophyceae sp. YPF-701]|nr:unnamed protein product [Pedinophyceae sp. YPF-701]